MGLEFARARLNGRRVAQVLPGGRLEDHLRRRALRAELLQGYRPLGLGSEPPQTIPIRRFACAGLPLARPPAARLAECLNADKLFKLERLSRLWRLPNDVDGG